LDSHISFSQSCGCKNFGFHEAADEKCFFSRKAADENIFFLQKDYFMVIIAYILGYITKILFNFVGDFFFSISSTPPHKNIMVHPLAIFP
jgi:hypothetical protein